jgi:superfamily II DNA/RNA helicase
MPAESSAAPESDLVAPETTFAALGVPAPLVEVLDEQGITAPFPVQVATLPDGLAGRDILGRARTGSGKTLGFSLPLVTRLAGGSTLRARPRGLVLVPTRELATQVTTVLKPLARAMDLWVTTIYGGVAYGPQVNALQRKTDIVVATPGRLADLIGQGECDLSDVEVTVIDEADQMADLGFLPIVRRLLETTPDHGQRMLFSATLDAAVDVLARRFLHDPVLHSVDENSSPAEIEHHVLTVEPANRVAVIAALTGGEQRSLVFTRTKHGAERLARQLTDAGIPAAELHGNLRQGARSRNLAAFTSGLARVMVATDIAARGIHIDGIDLVIHADPPAEHKAYVHRSGRTARGGADGVVVTLQTKAQARDVTAMMRKAGITPHAAVAVAPDSPEIAEIAGPPAPRVTVSGKVSELVRPEDRLARNDEPGVGKPWEGRPRRDRGQERNRKPRDDRFRDRGPRSFRDRAGFGDRPVRNGPRAGRDTPAAEVPGAVQRDNRESRFDRGSRFGRDERFQPDERPARSGRDDRPARADRDRPHFNRDDRPARFDRAERPDREDRAPRYERGERFGRDERPARADRDQPRRFNGDDRPARFDERPARFERGDRSGTGSQNYGDRQGRRDNQSDKGGNDWWPRSGGGSARPGYGRPGSESRNGQDFRGNRQFRDDRPVQDRTVQDRVGRDDRYGRDDRSGQDDRSARDDRSYRPARPQAGGRAQAGGRPTASGHSAGSARRSGYSAGRGVAGKRRGTGQDRHF